MTSAPAKLVRWQRITLWTLFGGYAGYYVCRVTLSSASPLLLEAFEGEITKADLGMVTSVGTAVYLLGKILNGLGVGRFGGRRLFLLGMAVSAGCTALFGAVAGLTAFTAVWALNRFFRGTTR